MWSSGFNLGVGALCKKDCRGQTEGSSNPAILAVVLGGLVQKGKMRSQIIFPNLNIFVLFFISFLCHWGVLAYSLQILIPQKKTTPDLWASYSSLSCVQFCYTLPKLRELEHYKISRLSMKQILSFPSSPLHSFIKLNFLNSAKHSSDACKEIRLFL